MRLTFILNGATRSLDTRPGESLLEVLRHRCGIVSVKDGCAPQGQCGCCLALVDGNPKMTCAVPAVKANGTEILTLEGVSAGERDLCARAFAAAAGVQCGFCIPGIALRAKWLLDRNRQPSRRQIARAIDPHLCRCTGYLRIIDAIELMARARRGESIPDPSTDGRVGQSLARYAAGSYALGDRPYAGDLVRQGMLYGAVALSPHALPAPTSSAAPGARSTSSTCISSRRARWPSRSPTAGCTCTRRGRACS